MFYNLSAVAQVPVVVQDSDFESANSFDLQGGLHVLVFFSLNCPRPQELTQLGNRVNQLIAAALWCRSRSPGR